MLATKFHTHTPLDGLHFLIRAVYEIMWKNRAEPQTTIWHRKDTHPAFPPQQWLHERTSLLGYMYTACPLEPDSQRNFRLFTYRTQYASE